MNSIKPLHSLVSMSVIALLPLCVSCGGGNSTSVPATATSPAPAIACSQYNSVTSGFTGDLNSEGPQGGSEGGGDSSGSAGVGGGLGKVLGAKVEVTRLSDGTKFGSQDTFTDPVDGLVRLQTCNVNEPLLITLKGTAQATYYDEGKNALLPFGPDQEIHALVEKVDGNIGISILTEAAYRFAINNFLADPKAIANGTNSLLKKIDAKELSKLTQSQIAIANQRVLQEINRMVPASYALTSITALPTPLGLDNQRTDLIPQNVYGQTAIITGAFSWMSDKFRIGTSSSTLDLLEEFSRDLTDGKIDGYSLDRSLASAAASTYESVTLPINLNVGANFIAEQFSAANLNTAYPFVDITAFRDRSEPCDSNTDVIENIFSLTKQGTVDLYRRTYRKCLPVVGGLVHDLAFNAAAGSDVKEIFTSQYSGGGFFVRANGQVLSWGNSECGQIANGQSSGIQSMPKVIDGLNNITSLANGYFFSIARDNDGRVYSWGSDGAGALGLGGNPPYNATCSSNLPNAMSRPTAVPGLNNIAQVFAHESRAFALDKSGRLYNWGQSCGRGGGGSTSSTPVLLPQPRAIRSFAANTQGCFAVIADATLIGWGFYNNIVHSGNRVYHDGQWFGDGTDAAKEQPTPLSGMSDVREVASDQQFFYALKGDGTVWRWGGSPEGLQFKTPTQITGIPELQPGIKVLIRHIKTDVEGARLFAQDGRIFAVRTWADAPSYLIEATDLYALK